MTSLIHSCGPVVNQSEAKEAWVEDWAVLHDQSPPTCPVGLHQSFVDVFTAAASVAVALLPLVQLLSDWSQLLGDPRRRAVGQLCFLFGAEDLLTDVCSSKTKPHQRA